MVSENIIILLNKFILHEVKAILELCSKAFTFGLNDDNFVYLSCLILQPNYFFSEDVPYSRLTEVCDLALQYGMGMEVEFDGNAQAGYGRGYRLRDYMTVFKDKGVWEKCRLAYYQGAWAVRWLKTSSHAEDKALYHDFCEFVTTRPVRQQ